MRKEGVGGVVIVQFVVEKDGTLSDIKVAKGINEELDNIAVKTVKEQSNIKWTPAKQGGRIVRQLFTLPLNFKVSK